MPYTLTRSLLVIILPGLLAMLPWALWLASQVEKLEDLYKTYGLLANALLVGLAILFGSISESALTCLEVRWDREREATLKVREYWFAYLALQPEHEPVGFRYISRRATTMYFELAMMVAAPLSLIGLAGLFSDYAYRLWAGTPVILGMLAIISLVFFYSSAKATHLLLCEARKEIVDRIAPNTP